MSYNYKYIFTANAKRDLDEILEYMTVDLANYTAALNFMDKVDENIK